MQSIRKPLEVLITERFRFIGGNRIKADVVRVDLLFFSCVSYSKSILSGDVFVEFDLFRRYVLPIKVHPSLSLPIQSWEPNETITILFLCLLRYLSGDDARSGPMYMYIFFHVSISVGIMFVIKVISGWLFRSRQSRFYAGYLLTRVKTVIVVTFRSYRPPR